MLKTMALSTVAVLCVAALGIGVERLFNADAEADAAAEARARGDAVSVTPDGLTTLRTVGSASFERSVRLVCAEGEAIVGAGGRGADRLESLAWRCRERGGADAATRETQAFPVAATDQYVSCGGERFAVGALGRHAFGLISFGVLCAAGDNMEATLEMGGLEGGMPFERRCPEGQLLVGAELADDNLGGIRLLCR